MRHEVRWTVRKIAQRLRLLEPLQYRRRLDLEPLRFRALEDPWQPIPPDGDDWTPVPPNTTWGGWRLDFAMRGSFTVPEGWGPAALVIPLGIAGDFSHPEALVYLDGQSWAGCDRHHQEVPLPAHCCDGQPHELLLHGWTGMGGGYVPKPGTLPLMGEPRVVEVHPRLREFLAAARVAHGIAEVLDPADPARGRLLNALDAAFRKLDTRAPLGDAFYESVPDALAALRAGVAQAGAPLDVRLHAAGHAHLDLAWLWTWDQTRQKGRRTFHTVLRNMERFPDYHFSQSQPALYHAVQNDDPALFEAVRERVRQGRWEPLGGMWVEADCTMSGPEALARQLLLGRRYFAETFGPEAESPILWLPDDFGFPASLPQLAVQAGLRYFMTIKIGWNQYNRLPFDTFWWQGLDGTRILTHFSTAADLRGVHASTYNAEVSPRQVMGTWTTLKGKEDQSDVLMAFGHGDGGGGPTPEMLENLREMRAFPSTPRCRQGPVRRFFRQLEAGAGELPVWNGELYLELHRGTFTSQSLMKRNNRKSEYLLHDAEAACAMASVLQGRPYPREAFDRYWRAVCLQQFHDILPGSSIAAVYEDAARIHATVQRKVTELRDGAVQALAAGSHAEVVVFNPTGFPRRDPVHLPHDVPDLVHADGSGVLRQGRWILPGEVPPYGLLELRAGSGPAPEVAPARAGRDFLENGLLRVELDGNGQVVRLLDLEAGREVLPPGRPANVLQAFEDRPLDWEAWDVDVFFEDRMWEPSAGTVRVVSDGPVRAAVQVVRQLGASTITQTLVLAAGSRRLDFETEVDWRERNVLLKAAFPVAVLSPTATYEVQWGHVQRPTHRNTSWDLARFECVARHWVDLSEGDYGVSLLNDCKYGHDVKDDVLRISLLRSPGEPDPTADLGVHRFTYSLLPHAGQLGEETVREGYLLNDPLLAVAGGGAPGEVLARPFLVATPSTLVVETVKGAEDGRGIVVRLYDSARRRGTGTLRCGFPVARAWRTDLLENDGAELEVAEGEVRFPYGPFEILTLRLE